MIVCDMSFREGQAATVPWSVQSRYYRPCRHTASALDSLQIIKVRRIDDGKSFGRYCVLQAVLYPVCKIICVFPFLETGTQQPAPVMVIEATVVYVKLVFVGFLKILALCPVGYRD